MARQLLCLNPQNFLRQVKQIESCSSLRLAPQELHRAITTTSFSLENPFRFSYASSFVSHYHALTNFVKKIRDFRIDYLVKRDDMDVVWSSTLHRLVVQAVEQYRAKTGLSQKAVARQCGILPSTLSEMVRGKVKLSVEQFEKVCAGLGITLQDIVNQDIIEGQIKPKFPDLEQEEYEVIAKAVVLLRAEKHRKTLTELIDAMHNFFVNKAE